MFNNYSILLNLKLGPIKGGIIRLINSPVFDIKKKIISLTDISSPQINNCYHLENVLTIKDIKFRKKQQYYYSTFNTIFTNLNRILSRK